MRRAFPRCVLLANRCKAAQIQSTSSPGLWQTASLLHTHDVRWQTAPSAEPARPPAPTMACWGTVGGGALQQLEVPTPTITSPRDLLVRVEAASVNPFDVAVLDGYGTAVLSMMRCLDGGVGGGTSSGRDGPLVVGRDFCGTVCSSGRGVRNFRAGQRVMGVVSPHRMGSHAEYVTTHEDNVVLAPAPLDAPSCASVPYAALTGYGAAVVTGACGSTARLKGRRVLVVGAAGGVGTVLVQMLRAWGAQVAGVCSADCFDLLTGLGVTELYDYNDEDAVTSLRAGHRFDLVIDGSGSREPAYLDALRQHSGATYVTLMSPLLRNTDAHGLGPGLVKSGMQLLQQNLNSYRDGRQVRWGYYMPSATALRELQGLLAQGQVVSVLDKVVPFSDARAAYEHMQHGRHRGKTVLDMTA